MEVTPSHDISTRCRGAIESAPNSHECHSLPAEELCPTSPPSTLSQDHADTIPMENSAISCQKTLRVMQTARFKTNKEQVFIVRSPRNLVFPPRPDLDIGAVYKPDVGHDSELSENTSPSQSQSHVDMFKAVSLKTQSQKDVVFISSVSSTCWDLGSLKLDDDFNGANDSFRGKEQLKDIALPNLDFALA
eukprot:148717-Rhodomonas_salina.2